MGTFVKFEFPGDSGSVAVNVDDVRFIAFESQVQGETCVALVFDKDHRIVVRGSIDSIMSTIRHKKQGNI